MGGRVGVWAAPLLLGGLAGATAGCLSLFREAPQLSASLDFPHEAQAGQAVTLSLKLKNPHPKAVTLDSIDVDDSILQGFQVLGVDPEGTGSLRLPIVNQRSWSFGTSVAPGGEMTVTFRLKALAPGRYTGNVDTCNPNQDCTSLLVDVVVSRY